MAKANGTEKPTYPRYKSSGWMSMSVTSRRGFRPRPSGGIGKRGAKGLAPKVMRSRKKAEIPCSTAWT